MTTHPLHDRLLTTILTAALAVASTHGYAQEPAPKSVKGKEKCYGVAKAGENGCQSQSGSHTCGGGSAVDYRGEDWKWVPTGSCLSMSGQLQPFDGFSKLAAAGPAPKPQ